LGRHKALVAVAILWRFLRVFGLALVVSVLLLRCAAAIVIVRCLALVRHCDDVFCWSELRDGKEGCRVQKIPSAWEMMSSSH
jgi:hypothetical protein